MKRPKYYAPYMFLCVSPFLLFPVLYTQFPGYLLFCSICLVNFHVSSNYGRGYKSEQKSG
jgi:hypothetical protein